MKDEATALNKIFKSLNKDNQALFNEYKTAYEFWAYLKTKYSQINTTTANKYITKIQTFTLEEGDTIIKAWDTLKNYCRKLGAANVIAKNAYSDSALLLVLIRALPEEYKTTIDTLNI